MEVYLDNASTTKIDDRVLKVMTLVMKENYGNPASIHKKGEEVRELLERSRKIISKKISCKNKEVFFCSGGTEANNLAIRGILGQTKRKRIICSKIEHASILKLCKELESEGYKVKYVNVNEEGLVDLKQLSKLINNNTALVTVMSTNNEIGTIQDIKKIGNICKKKKVAFHCDAVQSLCKQKISLKNLNITSMSFSAHKLHGPKGVGALYVNRKIFIKPLFSGGGQEKRLRPGTENVAGVVGFAEAVSLKDKFSQTRKLRDYFLNRLLKEIPGTKLNGSKKRLCNNINLRFENVEGESLLFHLNLKEIYVSTGSACSAREIGSSKVLQAIGLNEKEIQESIRFSLSKFTTKEELDYTIETLKEIVKTLREVK